MSDELWERVARAMQDHDMGKRLPTIGPRYLELASIAIDTINAATAEMPIGIEGDPETQKSAGPV